MTEAAPQKSPAWWVWIVAASFLLNFALVLRNDWIGPTLGFVTLGYNRDSFVVGDIYADSAASPLRAGDRILRADGQVIASDADWFVVLSNLRVGQPVIFDIQREGQTRQVSVTPARRSAVRFFRPGLLILLRIAQM